MTIRRFCPLILTLATLALSPPAAAGYFELGVAGSYKQSYIDSDSWELTSSYTASASWYFGPNSALEGSYTYGTQERYIHFTDRPDQTTTVYFESVGLDLVLTLLGPDAVIRPYVKGGAAYLLHKDLVYESGGTTEILNQETGFVPSAGIGIKIAITRDFALKLGADGWASTPGIGDRWDYVLRAGLSWML